MTVRMKQALAGLALTGALLGAGSSVAWGQSGSSSSTSSDTSSSRSDSSSSTAPGAPATPPAGGSTANCPNM